MSTVKANLAEIRDTIVAVLKENGRPMAKEALAEAVNNRIANQFPPDMFVRTFLKTNPELFGQTRDGLWGLREWEPRIKYGAVDVVRVMPVGKPPPQPGLFGSDNIRPEPYPEDLRTILMELLTHLTPNTDDQALLNEISCFELEQATYRTGQLVTKSGGEASDANTLVPRRLHEKMSYQSWRFPPVLETSFYVRPTDGHSFGLDVELVYGLASMFEYRDEQVESGRGVVLRARSSGNPQLPVPPDFSEVRLNGLECDLAEEDQPFKYFRKSGPLRFYHLTVSETADNLPRRYEVPAQEPDHVLVKLFDQSAKDEERIKAINTLDLYSPQGYSRPDKPDQPRVAAIALRLAQVELHLFIDTEYVQAVDAHLVTVKLSNQTDALDYPLNHALVLPHVKIRVHNADVLLPRQQHAERLDQATQTPDYHRPSALSELVRPSQINCVLTWSVRDPQTLICTTFGVYDFVRMKPEPGPMLADLYQNGIDGLLARAKVLEEETIATIRANPRWSAMLPSVMRAVATSFGVEQLHLFQWEAIQRRLNMLCGASPRQVSVINAPTGAGKTLVFFVNAALHYLFTGERAVMVFPTRILNEDMFKRLTRFVYSLRQELPDERITGGIFIGTSDPSYEAIVNPAIGEPMVQYEDKDGSCPQCREQGRPGKVRCQERGGRRIGVCEECGHEIDYMYTPRRVKIPYLKRDKNIAEVCAYLPSLLIATPDKLFYEATVAAPQGVLPLFGAPALPCECGVYYSLLYSDTARADIFECKLCGRTLDRTETKPMQSPLAYFVFDEVHSLYGVTATLISYFFNLLRQMTQEMGCPMEGTFETGTATIANERRLVETLTRQSDIETFPPKRDFLRYFRIQPRQVRYRTLMFMPVGTPTVRSLSNAIKYTYEGLHGSGQLKTRLSTDAYDFLLAYIPRKKDGHIVTNDVRRHMWRQSYFPQGATVRFLSGDSRASTIARILNDILDRNVNLLTANMVVSLGLDIPRLNNMLMMGVPQSMTEMVQTAGRTGRADAPGHVTVHLLPTNPRNEFVFRNFHQVMGDVEGYFDEKPVRPVNPYAADLILNNTVAGLLSARIAEDYRNAFCDRAGAWLNLNQQEFLGRLLFTILAADEDRAVQSEVVNAILGRFRRIATRLGNEDGQIWTWLKRQPDTLYSLRPMAERVDVQIEERSLFKLMKRGDMPQRVVSDEFVVEDTE
jgi:superfamily II DNA or RNA helicase